MGNCFFNKTINSIPRNFHIVIRRKKLFEGGFSSFCLSDELTKEEKVADTNLTIVCSLKNEQLDYEFQTLDNLNVEGSDLSIKLIKQNDKNTQNQIEVCLTNLESTLVMWEVLSKKEWQRKSQNFELKNEDILKLGEQIIKIYISKEKRKSEQRKLYHFKPIDSKCFNRKQCSDKYINSASDFSFLDNQKPIEKTEKANQNFFFETNSRCRICLDTETENDCFHSLCKCSSNTPTHLSCLKKSLSRKLTFIKFIDLKIYNFVDQKCDVCKSCLPFRFQIENKWQFLLNIELPCEEPFFMIEIYSSRSFNKVKSLIIGRFNGTESYSVGKALNNDIILNHNSVSNHHGTLKVDKDKLYFCDSNSGNISIRKLDSERSLFYKDAHFYFQGITIDIHSFKEKECDCNKMKFKMQNLWSFLSFSNKKIFPKLKIEIAKENSEKEISINKNIPKLSIDENKENNLKDISNRNKQIIISKLRMPSKKQKLSSNSFNSDSKNNQSVLMKEKKKVLNSRLTQVKMNKHSLSQNNRISSFTIPRKNNLEYSQSDFDLSSEQIKFKKMKNEFNSEEVQK